MKTICIALLIPLLAGFGYCVTSATISTEMIPAVYEADGMTRAERVNYTRFLLDNLYSNKGLYGSSKFKIDGYSYDLTKGEIGISADATTEQCIRFYLESLRGKLGEIESLPAKRPCTVRFYSPVREVRDLPDLVRRYAWGREVRDQLAILLRDSPAPEKGEPSSFAIFPYEGAIDITAIPDVLIAAQFRLEDIAEQPLVDDIRLLLGKENGLALWVLCARTLDEMRKQKRPVPTARKAPLGLKRETTTSEEEILRECSVLLEYFPRLLPAAQWKPFEHRRKNPLARQINLRYRSSELLNLWRMNLRSLWKEKAQMAFPGSLAKALDVLAGLEVCLPPSDQFTISRNRLELAMDMWICSNEKVMGERWRRDMEILNTMADNIPPLSRESHMLRFRASSAYEKPVPEKTIAETYEMERLYRSILGLSQIKTGLRAFHNYHGRYPASLSQLSGDFLSRIPLDPYSNNPYFYNAYNNGFHLFGWGPDGDDDGGETPWSHRAGLVSNGDLIFSSTAVKE
jgi:hypothetical protein